MDRHKRPRMRKARRAGIATVWSASLLLLLGASSEAGGFTDERVIRAEQPRPQAIEESAEDADGGSRNVVALAAVAAIAGAVIGLTVGRMLPRRRPVARPDPNAERTALPASSATQPRPGAPVTPAQDGRLVVPLIEGLIASHDLATNDAQRARIRDALRRADITPIEPDPLTRFDPLHHAALAVEPDTDPTKAGRIARVERTGWTRGDEVLRPPEVTVYPQARRDPPA